MKPLLQLKQTTSKDFQVDYEVIRDSRSISQDDKFLADEINKLTDHSDTADWLLAIASGAFTGLLDSFIVGEWDFMTAKDRTNRTVNYIVLDFANKHEGYIPYCEKNNIDSRRLLSAVKFLEDTYPLPGDGAYRQNKKITNSTHHLDDLCHHPTLVGLFCSIIVQFTGESIYVDRTGELERVPVTVNKYGQFIGGNPVAKLFSGILNWCFSVAHTVANTRGHWISDIAGSSDSASKGNLGAGLPGPFLSLIKELSTLPIVKSRRMHEQLRKAFQNGIGTRDTQVNLYLFNSLFYGASNKVDLRTELAIMHEIGRQTIPVVLNEVIVRSVYFIRRFTQEYRVQKKLKNIDLSKVMPFDSNNRTIARMLTISSGTFVVIDLADAAIRTALHFSKTGGTKKMFLGKMILRVNFPGIGRFLVAIGHDISLGVKKYRLENKKAHSTRSFLLQQLKLEIRKDDAWHPINENTPLTELIEDTKIEELHNIEEEDDFYVDTLEVQSNNSTATTHTSNDISHTGYTEPKSKHSVTLINSITIITLVLTVLASLLMIFVLQNIGINNAILYAMLIGYLAFMFMFPIAIYRNGILYKLLLFYYVVSQIGFTFFMNMYLYNTNQKIGILVPVVCVVLWIAFNNELDKLRRKYSPHSSRREDYPLTCVIIKTIFLSPVRCATVHTLALLVFRIISGLLKNVDKPIPFIAGTILSLASVLLFIFVDVKTEPE